MHSALELPRLAAYLTRAEAARDDREFPDPSAPARKTFSGIAFVGGLDRELQCERTGPVATLTIQGLGRYRLDLDGGAIRLLPPFPEPEAVEQALCGPCLALLLAHGGVFLLHASAVQTANGVVALVGRSGAGKSTLAAELARAAGAALLADDAVAVRLEGEDIVVPGAYPQPKWPDWGGPRGADLPDRLATVVELTPNGGDLELEPLAAPEALLAAATHTVAARLFDAELLERHFRFGRELISRAQWWRLRYAPQLSNLPMMVDRIRKLWPR